MDAKWSSVIQKNCATNNGRSTYIYVINGLQFYHDICMYPCGAGNFTNFYYN